MKIHQNVKKISKIGIILVVTLYSLSALLFFFYQNKLVYQPTLDEEHNYPVIKVKNDSEILEVIALNSNMNTALLYFGGSGEYIIDHAKTYQHLFPTHATYLANYRGYGGSSGVPSQKGLYSDALAVFDKIAQDHDSIHVIGYSLGTGVATHLAAHRELNSLTLIAPFDSMISVASVLLPMYPVSIMLKDTYRSIDKAEYIDERTLIITAEKDTNIPYKITKRLIDSLPSDQVTIKTIINSDHNSVGDPSKYHATLKDFIH